jgi:hypothetical protein
MSCCLAYITTICAPKCFDEVIMKRFKKALGVGFVFTFYVSCFYFAFSVFSSLVEGTDTAAAALSTLTVGAVTWAVSTFAVYELLRFVDERNAREDEERRKREDEYRKKTGQPPLDQTNDQESPRQ